MEVSIVRSYSVSMWISLKDKKVNISPYLWSSLGLGLVRKGPKQCIPKKENDVEGPLVFIANLAQDYLWICPKVFLVEFELRLFFLTAGC